MDSGRVLSSRSSFIRMLIPIHFNSYLFLNRLVGRITAMWWQMKRCWSLCYGHSANSSYVHSSGILPFNFLFCQWINIKVVVIQVQRKDRMKRPLKKYITDCEISGSERFHTPNSQIALCLAFFFLIFISLSTLTWYSTNNNVLFLWCQLSSCNIVHDRLIGMTTNFTNSVILRGKNKESGKEKKKDPNPKIPYHSRHSKSIVIIIARITNGKLQLCMDAAMLPINSWSSHSQPAVLC